MRYGRRKKIQVAKNDELKITNQSLNDPRGKRKSANQ
jgi:hypothetical protein